jgi:PIN domain nuclease of toxin-antitoxin system
MTILLDTHTLIWWLEGSKNLSKKALTILSNPKETIFVSAAVAWEIAIKVNLGKIESFFPVTDIPTEIETEGFRELSIAMDHAIRAGSLPLHHRDPFDRLLVAQSQILDAPILSADRVFDTYKIIRIW